MIDNRLVARKVNGNNLASSFLDHDIHVLHDIHDIHGI